MFLLLQLSFSSSPFCCGIMAGDVAGMRIQSEEEMQAKAAQTRRALNNARAAMQEEFEYRCVRDDFVLLTPTLRDFRVAIASLVVCTMS